MLAWQAALRDKMHTLQEKPGLWHGLIGVAWLGATACLIQVLEVVGT